VAKKNSRWSQRVTRESNALDLEAGVFAKKDPRKIALSLKRSAEKSRRRKSDSYRSAMSMLTFYINRAGRLLSGEGRRRLERAKDELRSLYGKRSGRSSPSRRSRHPRRSSRASRMMRSRPRSRRRVS